MKINSRNVFGLTLPLLFFLCNAADPNASEKNLESIVNFNEVLDESTPSQFASHNFKAYFNQNALKKEQALLKERHQVQESRTVIFQKSFLKYVKEVYNSRNYANVLSQDASHIVQFLELSNELNLGTDLVYVCLRLFYNKIKACELVDDTMLAQVLSTMPQLLERHFVENQRHDHFSDLTFLQKHFEGILLGRFTQHLSEFQQKPDTFMSSLATELAQFVKQQAEQIKKQQQSTEKKERLRSIVIRFFDTTLSKAIWNPKAPEGIWKSFTGIANGLQLLGNHAVLDQMDDLDDLLWTLNHRFCFFLDLTGTSLPTSFYEEVEQDLANRSIFFLEYKEQDEGIMSKKDHLLEALLQGKAKALAYEKKGYLSMPVIKQ